MREGVGRGERVRVGKGERGLQKGRRRRWSEGENERVSECVVWVVLVLGRGRITT